MTSDAQTAARSGSLSSICRGVAPLLVVCLLLWVLLQQKPANFMATVATMAVCGLILWFGWSSIRKHRSTRLFGWLLAIYIGAVLGLFVAVVAIGLSLLLMPLLLIAFPFVIWDLLFRAPSQGPAAEDTQDPAPPRLPR